VNNTYDPVDAAGRKCRMLSRRRNLSKVLCYLSGQQARSSFPLRSEKNFKTYVENGALSCRWIAIMILMGFRSRVSKLNAQDLWVTMLFRIPNNHPIYSTFFELKMGHPATSFELNRLG